MASASRSAGQPWRRAPSAAWASAYRPVAVAACARRRAASPAHARLPTSIDLARQFERGFRARPCGAAGPPWPGAARRRSRRRCGWQARGPDHVCRRPTIRRRAPRRGFRATTAQHLVAAPPGATVGQPSAAARGPGKLRATAPGPGSRREAWPAQHPLRRGSFRGVPSMPAKPAFARRRRGEACVLSSVAVTRVGIIGLGYVGLPLATAFAEVGVDVLGVDVSASKVDAVNAGTSYIEDVDSKDLAQLVASGRLRASTDPAGLRECDAILICLPTPLDEHRNPDLTYVIAGAEMAAANLGRDALVVLESTTYPGTTREVVKPILERDGRIVGEDVFLAFSPERVDPGNAALRHPQHAQGGRRPDARVHQARRGALRAHLRDGPRGLHAGERGDGQDPGEHLPRGEHCPGQRDGHPVRPHGHRPVGVDRRGVHQALRLHALLAGARASAATASPSTRST